MDTTEQSTPRNARSQWRAKATLLAIAMLFFLPVLVAIGLNVYAPHWQPFGYSNRGELIRPAIQAEPAGLVAKEGRRQLAQWLNKRWILVSMTSGSCQQDCEKALLRMQQVQRALGKDSHRVRRLLIRNNNKSLGEKRLRELRTQFPGLRLASIRNKMQFSPLTGVRPGEIFVLDPRSFLILRFSESLSASDMLKDLQHLLKLAKRS